MKDKIAIVTGGSRGIGAAIVKRFAAAGAKVYFTYANSESAAHGSPPKPEPPPCAAHRATPPP